MDTKIPKSKENFTIDVEVATFVRNFPSEYKSASDFVNSIILNEMAKQTDMDKEYYDACKEIANLELKVRGITKKWEKIEEEGNKAEREEARKKLEEEHARLMAHAIRFTKCILQLKSYGLYEAFLKCKTHEECVEVAKKAHKIMIEQKLPMKYRYIGAIDMFRIITFNFAPTEEVLKQAEDELKEEAEAVKAVIEEACIV